MAVEPFPDCYARLHGHVRANELELRIQHWNVGLGERSEERFTSRQGSEEPDCPSQSRAFVGQTSAGTNTVAIPVWSMAELVERTCAALECDQLDFLKLDVEGIEHAALTTDAVGALKRVRQLGMEYHPNGPKSALFKLLADAGLHCKMDLPVHENSGVALFSRNHD